MPFDQALVGSALTGLLALLSQAVGKCKCHVACRRDHAGEYCEPSCHCGFLDVPLSELEQTSDKSKDDTHPSID